MGEPVIRYGREFVFDADVPPEVQERRIQNWMAKNAPGELTTATPTPPPAAATPQDKGDVAPEDVPRQFVENLAPSMLEKGRNIIGGMAHAVSSPTAAMETIKNVLGGAGTSPFLGGWGAIPGTDLKSILGKVAPDLVPAVEKIQEPAAAIKEQYGEKYGTGQKILNTLAKDPAEAMLDASMLAMPGARLAGATGTVGKIGRAARAVEVAGDPVELALKALGAGRKIAREVVGAETGTTGTPLSVAFQTGYEGGKKGTDFRTAIKGQADVEQVVDTAEKGIAQIKKDSWAEYQKNKNDPKHGWSKDSNTIDFAPIEQAWRDLEDSYRTRSGAPVVDTKRVMPRIQEIGEKIAEWKAQPGWRTPDDMDALKQNLSSLWQKGDPPQLKRAIATMENAVSSQLKKDAPGYTEAMKYSSESMREMNNLKSAFSLGDGHAVQVAMAKLQSAMRDGANTLYGNRTSALKKIEEKGGVSISPSLAGMAASSWTPRGISRGVMAGALPFSTGAALATSNPILPILGTLASLSTASPRLMNSISHTMGRAAGLPDRFARHMGMPFLGEPFGRAGLSKSPLGLPFGQPARQAIRQTIPPEEEQTYADGGEVPMVIPPPAAVRGFARRARQIPARAVLPPPPQLPQAAPDVPQQPNEDLTGLIKQFAGNYKTALGGGEGLEAAGVIKNLNDTLAKYARMAPATSANPAAAVKPSAPPMSPTAAPEGSPEISAVYDVKKAYDLVKQAGGTDEEARTLAAIAQAESGGRAGITNFKAPDQSYGLWQINMIDKLGPQRRAQFGLKSNEDLFDPLTNARVALALKRARNNYNDWTTYASGAHKKFLPGDTV